MMTYIFGTFVMFIFAFLCLALGVHGYPDCAEDGARMYHCLNKWRLYSEFGRQPSAFLTDEILVEEICSAGDDNSVKAVDKCIHDTVSSDCQNVRVVWKGTKQKMQFLCKHLNAYHLHTRCRTNKQFVRKFKHCVQDHVSRIQDPQLGECWSYSQLEMCFSQALKEHCTPAARKYFELVFHSYNSPFKTYARCTYGHRKAKGPTYDIHEPLKHNIIGNHMTNADSGLPVRHVVGKTTTKLAAKQTANAAHEERLVVVPIWDQHSQGDPNADPLRSGALVQHVTKITWDQHSQGDPNADPLRSGALVQHVTKITTVLAGLLTVIVFTTT